MILLCVCLGTNVQHQKEEKGTIFVRKQKKTIQIVRKSRAQWEVWELLELLPHSLSVIWSKKCGPGSFIHTATGSRKMDWVNAVQHKYAKGKILSYRGRTASAEVKWGHLGCCVEDSVACSIKHTTAMWVTRSARETDRSGGEAREKERETGGWWKGI